MPYCHLRRGTDQKTFTAQPVNDHGALFYFSILVGEGLTFDGAGLPAYLLGKCFLSGPQLQRRRSTMRAPR
jgi:hypothetical protein